MTPVSHGASKRELFHSLLCAASLFVASHIFVSVEKFLVTSNLHKMPSIYLTIGSIYIIRVNKVYCTLDTFVYLKLKLM